jgi:nitroreductase
MDLYECLESRKSFLSFLPKKVEKAALERILQAAYRSPSYMNSQPWEVFAVVGEKRDILTRKLLEMAASGAASRPDLAFPKDWPEVIDKRIKEHRLRRFKALGIDPNDQETIKAHYFRNFEFYDAPCVLFIGMEKSLTPWSIFDLGLITSSILMAAWADGLGCCPQALSMGYPDVVREELGIPDNISLILSICMGYPDFDAVVNQYTTSRKGLTESVTWYGFDEK